MAKLVAKWLSLGYLKEVAPIFVQIGLVNHMVLCQCGHG